MTFNLPKLGASERIITSPVPNEKTRPEATIPTNKAPENLTPQNTSTLPTFGQSTLGKSFARFAPSTPAFDLGNTKLPVALTVPGGTSTNDPLEFTQQLNTLGTTAVQNKVNQLTNPYNINI
jgi:hypothetical protein